MELFAAVSHRAFHTARRSQLSTRLVHTAPSGTVTNLLVNASKIKGTFSVTAPERLRKELVRLLQNHSGIVKARVPNMVKLKEFFKKILSCCKTVLLPC